MEIDKLVQKLNGFDLYFEMSDDPSVREKGQKAREALTLDLASNAEFGPQIKEKVDENGKIAINRYFKHTF